MLNVSRIRQQLKKAIDISPTEIVLKRKPLISDGMGGYYTGAEVTVATFNGLLKLDKSGISERYVDAGDVVKTTSISLMAVIEDSWEIKQDDYFTAAGTTYTVTLPVPMNSIYWQCKIEVSND